MLTIIHVVECFAGGTVHFIEQLTSQLKECNHIIIHGERSDEIDAETVKKRFRKDVKFIHWTGVQREINLLADIRACIHLYKIIQRNANAHVIHLHSSKAGFLGRFVGWLLNKRNILYTPHGASFNRQDISLAKRNLFIYLEKLASYFSEDVVACSLSEQRSFLQQGIKVEKYINNGTIISEPVPSKFFRNKFRIVTSGRITAQKRPHLFNDIAKELLTDPNVEFTWIGAGELQDALTSPNVRITGWLPSNRVKLELYQADLYLSCSAWEGLPFAVMEAMQLGKPLLLSNCVGNVDLVDDGFNGFLYDTTAIAATKINYLLKHPHELELLGSNSRKKCYKEFNIESTAQSYMSHYRRIAAVTNSESNNEIHL